MNFVLVWFRAATIYRRPRSRSCFPRWDTLIVDAASSGRKQDESEIDCCPFVFERAHRLPPGTRETDGSSARLARAETSRSSS